MGRQQMLDGKLNKADAMEGAGILFLPLVLAVVGVIGTANAYFFCLIFQAFA